MRKLSDFLYLAGPGASAPQVRREGRARTGGMWNTCALLVGMLSCVHCSYYLVVPQKAERRTRTSDPATLLSCVNLKEIKIGGVIDMMSMFTVV